MEILSVDTPEVTTKKLIKLLESNTGNLPNKEKQDVLAWLKSANERKLHLNNPLDIKAIKLLSGRIKGLLDLKDNTDKLNAEMFAEFNKLFKNNLLFFLLTVNNWSLFFRFFIHGNLSDGKFRAFLHNIRRQRKVKKAIQSKLLTPIPSPQVIILSAPLIGLKLHQEYMNRGRQYYLLEQEYAYTAQRYRQASFSIIVHDYAKIRSFTHNVTQYAAKIIAHHKVPEPIKIKAAVLTQEIQELEAEIIRNHDKLLIESKKDYVVDGKVDTAQKLKAVQKHRAVYEASITQAKIKRDALFAINQALINDDPREFKTLIAQNQEALNTLDNAFEASTKRWKQVDDGYLPVIGELETKLAALKQDITTANKYYIIALINTLNALKNTPVSNEEHLALDKCLEQLRLCKKQLDNTQDIDNQQAILWQCSTVINPLKFAVENTNRKYPTGTQAIIPILGNIQEVLTEKASLKPTNTLSRSDYIQTITTSLNSQKIESNNQSEQYSQKELSQNTFRPTLSNSSANLTEQTFMKTPSALKFEHLPTESQANEPADAKDKNTISLFKNKFNDIKNSDQNTTLGNSIDDNEEKETPESMHQDIQESSDILRIFIDDEPELDKMLDKIEANSYKTIGSRDLTSINNKLMVILKKNPSDSKEISRIIDTFAKLEAHFNYLKPSPKM